MKYKVTGKNPDTGEIRFKIVNNEYERDMLIASLLDSMVWIVTDVIKLEE